MDEAGIPALVDAILHLHGVEAKHVETKHVHEKHDGQTVWRGDVEVFELIAHKLATVAYAWSEPTTGTRRRFFAVLRVAPIDSPEKAVQASILADAKAIDKASG